MVKTREMVKQEILLELGSPVIDNEITIAGTKQNPYNHLDYAINHTIQMFQSYNSDESIYQTWVTLPLKPGVSVYPVPSWVAEVVDVYASSGLGMTSPFMMFNSNSYESLLTMTVNFSDWDFIGYTTAQMLLKEIQKAVGPQYYGKLIENGDGSKELHVFPPPSTQSPWPLAGMLNVYKYADINTVYGHRLFVQIAAGKLGMMWAGVILGKFSAGSPGGESIDKSSLYSHFKSMYETNLEKLRKESCKPMIFFG